MPRHAQRSLHAAQASFLHKLDAGIAAWNTPPFKSRLAPDDPFVISVFTDAGGLSITASLALIAITPR